MSEKERKDQWGNYPLGELFAEGTERCTRPLPLLAVTGNDGVILRSTLRRKDTSPDDKSKYKVVHVDDIAYNTMRLWQGVVGWSRHEGIVSPAYTVLRPASGVDGQFYGYLLKTPWMVQQFLRRSQGICDDTNNCKYNSLKVIEAVSPPLPEQRKIASILTTVDRLIEQTEALIEKYRRVKQGMMADLLSRGVDEHGKLRPTQKQAPQLYKQSELGWIPKDWFVGSITDCCDEVFLGLTSKVDYVKENGVPLVRATNINGGVLSFAQALFISERQHRQLTKYRRAKRGDILVSKSGSLGVCAIVDTDRQFSIYESIIVLQPDNNRLCSTFLLWLMRDGGTQDRLLSETVGSTVGHLNLNDFKRLKICVPSTGEQAAIAAKLESLAMKSSTEREGLKKLRTLKTGLMQDLLTGKVRVKVEQDEEPTQPTPSATTGVGL